MRDQRHASKIASAALMAAVAAITIMRAAEDTSPVSQVDVLTQLQEAGYKPAVTGTMIQAKDGVYVHLTKTDAGKVIVSALSTDLPEGTIYGIRKLACKPVMSTNVSQSVKAFQALIDNVRQGKAHVTAKKGSNTLLNVQFNGGVCVGETQ